MPNEHVDTNIFEFRDKKSISREPETVTFHSDDEAAIFILTLLKQHKFSPEQLFDAKRFVKKWLRHFTFKELVMELSMLLDTGEDYFYLTFNTVK